MSPLKRTSDRAQLSALNRNLVRLANHLERMNLADLVDVSQRPGKLIWNNFLAGLFRGVGLFVGGGIMGALTLALLTWGIYHLLTFFNMIPILSGLTRELTNQVNTFLAAHNIHK